LERAGEWRLAPRPGKPRPHPRGRKGKLARPPSRRRTRAYLPLLRDPCKIGLRGERSLGTSSPRRGKGRSVGPILQSPALGALQGSVLGGSSFGGTRLSADKVHEGGRAYLEKRPSPTQIAESGERAHDKTRPGSRGSRRRARAGLPQRRASPFVGRRKEC